MSLLGFGGAFGAPEARNHHRGSSSRSFGESELDDDDDHEHFDHEHDPTWAWNVDSPHFNSSSAIFAAAAAVAEVPPHVPLEETMTVCYALANAVQADPSCAERVLNNGLMSIMLRLAER
jgi:hypothetical protein